jgi:pimeloyl-ACP methyl ester carboxylesterase
VCGTASAGTSRAARRGRVRAWLGAVLCVVLAWPALAAGDDIPVRGRSLHIDCEGRGAPAVILDAGLGGSSLEWVFVVERLRGLTTVCTFDRAGYGASAMGPLPRTSSRIANELYLLLDAAEVPAPYILVGHSFGGYNMQIFARRYAYRAAGLVLIDASHPHQVERFLAPPLRLLTAPSSRYGIVQFRDPPPPSALLPEPARRLIAERARRWKTRRTLGSELLSFRDSALELSMALPLGDLPLLVITRGRIEGEVDDKRLLMERLWLELQTELAAESTTAAHLIAREAGHNIHVEQPGLVAYGIALLVERQRFSTRPEQPFAAAAATREVLEDATWLRDDLAIHPHAQRRPLVAHYGAGGGEAVR